MQLRANLPSWGLGSKAALPLKGKKQATAVPVAQQSAWKVAPDDTEDELLDDDELLTEADLQRPAAGPCGHAASPFTQQGTWFAVVRRL